MATRKIKICDGFKLITSEKVYRYHHITDVWKAFGWDIKTNKEADASASEITRQLMMFRRVDLSKFTEDGTTCIIEVIPADNFRIEVKEAGKKRFKPLNDIKRFEEDATAEVERLNATCDMGHTFRVGRWE